MLTEAQIAAAHAAAASAPPLTPRQRDRLSNIFGPTLRALHTADATR